MATKLSQFNIFFRRTCLLLARDRHQFAVDCCIQLACGAFFGLLYENFEFKDAQTLFFMLNLGVGLTASLASLRVFGSDRAVFWREAAPGSGMELDRFAYFLAKNAVEVPRLAVFATLTLATFARPRRRRFIFLWATYSFAVGAPGVAAGAHRGALRADVLRHVRGVGLRVRAEHRPGPHGIAAEHGHARPRLRALLRHLAEAEPDRQHGAGGAARAGARGLSLSRPRTGPS